MYKTGLTQENSVYDLSLLGDTNNNTGATDFSNMSDEEILKAFEEKQNSENADNKDITFDFMEHMMSPEVYLKAILDQGNICSLWHLPWNAWRKNILCCHPNGVSPV